MGKYLRKYPKIEFDGLQLYFNNNYVIDLDNAVGKITITPPYMGQIIDFGETRFKSTLNIFISNSTMYRSLLWEAHKDWNETTDYELFLMIYKGIDIEAGKLLFNGLDFSKFKPSLRTIDDKPIPILYNEEDKIEINEDVYEHIHQYLQTLFNSFPEDEFTKDPMLKKWWIDKDKRETARQVEKKNNGEIETTSIQPLISACVNHPGFKYKLNELKEVGVAEFYDSVKRLQVYENTTALLKGIYGGMVSAKDIDADATNFMKKI